MERKTPTVKELLEERLEIEESMARGDYGCAGYSELASVNRRIQAARDAEKTRRELAGL